MGADVLHQLGKIPALKIAQCFKDESVASIAGCGPNLRYSKHQTHDEGKGECDVCDERDCVRHQFQNPGEKDRSLIGRRGEHHAS
jgi:hypothetical protein